MKPRVLFTPLAALASALILYLAIATAAPPKIPEDSPADASWPKPLVVVDREYRGRTAEAWYRLYRRARSDLRRRWNPTVDYAYRLASAVFSVPYWQLHSVGGCESHHWPFARNGVHKGIFQMWWRPFGFSQYDPIASALSAAQTVRHDGGWRQWECKP